MRFGWGEVGRELPFWQVALFCTKRFMTWFGALWKRLGRFGGVCVEW
jgi:hypothetical protein